MANGNRGPDSFGCLIVWAYFMFLSIVLSQIVAKIIKDALK